jgi:hypothetical protein
LQSRLADRTGRTGGTDLSLYALRSWFAGRAVRARVTLWSSRPGRTGGTLGSYQCARCDIAPQRSDLCRHGTETFVDAPLTTQHLGVDGLHGVSQQERGLIPGKEVVTFEVPVGECFLDSQGCQPGSGPCCPVIGRHVSEPEAGVGESRHRIGATRVGVDAGEEPIYQQGSLVPGHGVLTEEGPIGEARIYVGLRQMTEGAPTPFISSDLTDSYCQCQQAPQGHYNFSHSLSRPYAISPSAMQGCMALEQPRSPLMSVTMSLRNMIDV